MSEPAVIYGAKSTEDVRGSIPTQLEDCRRVATEAGWHVVGEFSDERASGYSGSRGPKLEAAMRAAEAAVAEHGVCHLIVQNSDRLARGDGKTAKHLAEYFLWALQEDVKLVSVQDDQSFGDLLYAVVTGQRNHEDSRRKSLAVRSGMERRRAKGMHNGGPAKLGYEYVRDSYGRTVGTEPLRHVPAEAALVMRIYESYVAGVKQNQIQREFNAEGHTTKRGKRWHQGTIAHILADPFYMGYVVDPHSGELLRGAHEPIVTEALWRQAEALREAGRKSSGGRRGRQTNGRHLLVNGHLRCGRCGSAMVPRTMNRKHGEKVYPYESYTCYRRIQNKADCDMPPIKREQIDQPIVVYFARVGIDVAATRDEMIAATRHRVAEVHHLREQAEREAMAADERLARVKRAFQDGHLDAQDWAEQRRELLDEQEAAAARAKTLAEREALVAASGALSDVEEATLRRLADLRAAVVGDLRRAGDVDALRAALSRLFSAFVLHDNHSGPTRVDGDLFADAARFLEPVMREDAFDGCHVLRVDMDTGETTEGSPTLRRVPLPTAHSSGGNNDVDGLAKKSSAPASKARRRSGSAARPLRTSTRQRRVDPGARRVGGADLADDAEARAVGQADVEHREVRVARLDQRQRLARGVGRQQLAAVGGELVGEERARRRVVLGDQDGGGRVIAHVLPRARGDEIRPPPRGSAANSGESASQRWPQNERTDCKIPPRTCEREGFGHTMPTTSGAAVHLGATTDSHDERRTPRQLRLRRGLRPRIRGAPLHLQRARLPRALRAGREQARLRLRPPRRPRARGPRDAQRQRRDPGAGVRAGRARQRLLARARRPERPLARALAAAPRLPLRLAGPARQGGRARRRVRRRVATPSSTSSPTATASPSSWRPSPPGAGSPTCRASSAS